MKKKNNGRIEVLQRRLSMHGYWEQEMKRLEGLLEEVQKGVRKLKKISLITHQPSLDSKLEQEDLLELEEWLDLMEEKFKLNQNTSH